MSLMNTFIVINLVVWIPWLWIYKINPFFVGLRIKQQLKKQPEWKSIHLTEILLNKLYKRTNAHRTSRKELKRLAIHNNDFIYGEIQFLSFITILNKIKPKAHEIFYDLGCGSGKAVFTAALYFNFSKVYGIELLPGLYSLAKANIQKAKSIIKSEPRDLYRVYSNKIKKIHFLNQNFLNCTISDADIVYINATCMNPATWSAIVDKLLALKIGSRVIINSKKIPHEQFQLLYKGGELMSWGVGLVNIYVKVS